ncbi:LOW QUALITY PROTEIN: hypothetical protein PHMEG_00018579 [Phytophthora megakarya]|uniref:Uncharacterized protein n=1 Tax=Phytophthora megakarya TaxID=4795 RepID=A0A225VUK8_9STRA|nr:LOW QUALITY PROTEIN: hypothetical protein PHMEG_00018579 [Phytophthora megakarya]
MATLTACDFSSELLLHWTVFHLSASTQTVHPPPFDRTVVKLLSDHSLTPEEEAVAGFGGPTEPTVKAQKKTEPRYGGFVTGKETSSKYCNQVSRLAVHDDDHKQSFRTPRLAVLLLANFEMLLSLRANREL